MNPIVVIGAKLCIISRSRLLFSRWQSKSCSPINSVLLFSFLEKQALLNFHLFFIDICDICNQESGKNCDITYLRRSPNKLWTIYIKNFNFEHNCQCPFPTLFALIPNLTGMQPMGSGYLARRSMTLRWWLKCKSRSCLYMDIKFPLFFNVSILSSKNLSNKNIIFITS